MAAAVVVDGVDEMHNGGIVGWTRPAHKGLDDAARYLVADENAENDTPKKVPEGRALGIDNDVVGEHKVEWCPNPGLCAKHSKMV